MSLTAGIVGLPNVRKSTLFNALTNAGALLADQNIYRHNRIFCTRWNGLNKTSLEEASDDDEYSGGIVKLLDSALNFVKKNTKKKWKKIATGRVEIPEYDESHHAGFSGIQGQCGIYRTTYLCLQISTTGVTGTNR